MKLSKRQQFYDEVEKIKERIKDTPTETLKLRLTSGSLTKEGAIAIREALAEREPDEKMSDSKVLGSDSIVFKA